MAINFHPAPGTLLICDFSHNCLPEMVKRRPAVVVSPRFRQRPNLCTVVPCSTTPPTQVQPYHYLLELDAPLPAPYDSHQHWVKADMLYTVSFSRLFVPHNGKDLSGRRMYDLRVLHDDQFEAIRACILHGLGVSGLT